MKEQFIVAEYESAQEFETGLNQRLQEGYFLYDWHVLSSVGYEISDIMKASVPFKSPDAVKTMRTTTFIAIFSFNRMGKKHP